MNILIAGGSGLIGRALIQKLSDSGHQIAILSRNPAKVPGVPESVQVIGWDSKTTAGWGAVVNQMDVIVNLAGAPLNGNGLLDIWLTERRKHDVLHSRLDAATALLDAVEQGQNRPSAFLQASAVGYYGAHGDEVIVESGDAGSDFLSSVQVQAEQVSARAANLGMRHIIFRTGLVLDGNEGALQYFKLQHALFVGGKMGSGKQYYSWIHLEDEAAALQFLIENQQASGAYNLTAPNPVTNAEFSKILGRVMKRPSYFPVPAFLLRLVLGEVSMVVLEGQRVIPDRLLNEGFEFQYANLENALQDVLN